MTHDLDDRGDQIGTCMAGHLRQPSRRRSSASCSGVRPGHVRAPSRSPAASCQVRPAKAGTSAASRSKTLAAVDARPLRIEAAEQVGQHLDRRRDLARRREGARRSAARRHSTLTNVPSFSAWVGTGRATSAALASGESAQPKTTRNCARRSRSTTSGRVGAAAEVAVGDHEHRALRGAVAQEQLVLIEDLGSPCHCRRSPPSVSASSAPAAGSAPRRSGSWSGDPALEVGDRPARRRGRPAPRGGASPAWSARRASEPRLLGGQVAGAEEGHRAFGAHAAAAGGRASSASFQPPTRCPPVLAAHAAGAQARHGLVALEGRAAVVAHPVVVDLGVEARLVALDVPAAVLDRDVAAHVAAGADRRLLVEVEDALGEAEAGGGERADRADVHDAGRQRVVQLACPGRCRSRSRAPRLKKPSSPVPATSWVKRTQRVHWMHRFMLRITLGPSGMRSRPG